MTYRDLLRQSRTRGHQLTVEKEFFLGGIAVSTGSLSDAGTSSSHSSATAEMMPDER